MANEAVISGIGGKFPECYNVEEFKDKLFSKTNLLKPDLSRWTPAKHSKPFTCGKILDWDRFDRTLFGTHSKLVRNSDPMTGQMIECSFKAIMDAGLNPFTLKGRNVSVITATSLSEAELLRSIHSTIEGLGMVGNSRAMMANRISYCFNFTGPSYNCDSSWTSGMQALKIATTLVSQGATESAVVVSSNLTFFDSLNFEYQHMGMLSPDGKCSPFDAQANGFARSEGVVAFFIQRAADAKRNYCSIVNFQSLYIGNRACSYLKIGPSLETFFQDFYSSCKVNPSDVSYIEANGYCVKDSDGEELNALANVFYNQKKSPVLIGSVKGNMGNSESVSGFLSLIKVIIALEEGVIPPTVNYNTPNPNVPSLLSGDLQPVTEPTPLPGDLAAVNCMSCFGSVSHVLVKRHNKTKQALSVGELPEDGLPRLVVLQARHEEGARSITDKLCSMPVDVEFVSLVNDVFKAKIQAYLWGAYAILPPAENTATQNVELFNPTKRPLWFIFSGMGSQWTGMGRDLLQIPVFAAAIDKCDQVLRPRGFDIKHILTTDDSKVFNNILNCFIGIAAVQIGMVDILNALGVTPDGMIGHSVGELGCAYADGCFSAEETVLAAYARGKASLESDVIQGMMAAVGLGYNDIKDRLPPTIEVACHNSVENCTLSGPTDDVMKYVGELKDSGVFAKAVSAGNIAYHSRYIKPIAPKLLEYLREMVSNPKPRSSRWVSSSVPQDQWDTHDAKMCSAEYHTNNLLNPVLFEEACQHLPKNAVVVEIAPHGLLQSILKRLVQFETINISLANRNAAPGIHYLLNAIGKLHLHNVAVNVNALYPEIQYPVSRATRSLVDVISLDHTDVWYHEFSSHVNKMFNTELLEKEIEIHTKVPSYQTWRDHCINGQVTIPFLQLIMYPWTMILASKHLEVDNSTVIIEDVTISDNVTVEDDAGKKFVVTLGPATYNFEVSLVSADSDHVTNIITGKLHETDNAMFTLPPSSEDLEEMDEVAEEEIYCLLAQFGCMMGSQFQTITQILIGKSECIAKVRWTGDVIIFLDALFKIIVFLRADEQEALVLPAYFHRLTVNTLALTNLPIDSEVEVRYNYQCNTLVCEAVQLLGISLSVTSNKRPLSLRWTELKLTPYFNTNLSLEEFLSTSLQLTSESGLGTWSNKPTQVTVLEIKIENGKPSIFTDLLKDTFKSHLFFSSKLKEVDFNKAKEIMALPGYQQCYLVAGEYNTLAALVNTASVQDNVYCLAEFSNNGTPTHNRALRPVLVHESQAGKMALLKKANCHPKVTVFEVKSYDWLRGLQQLITSDVSQYPVVVISRSVTPREMLPTLAAEPFAHRLRTVFILDQNAPPFSLTSPMYSAQLSLGLPVNILSGGVWGSLRAFSLDVIPHIINLDCLIKSTQKKGLDIICVGLNTTTFIVHQPCDSEEPEVKYVDYSGYLAGERVMGVAQFDTDLNCLTADSILSWPVPEQWTIEDAATVPVIYSLAYYCIHLRAKVEAGEDVLIHAGMSPLGQAAIAVTLQLGGNVFASVISEEEVLTLLKMFPTIKPNHVLVLGSQDIAMVVRKLTDGKGVEVVVNCLRGKDMQSSIGVMGYDCRFLHLSSIKVENRESVGMTVFLKRTSFFGVSLDNISNCSDNWKSELRESVQKGIEQGIVKPLRRSLYSLKQESEALWNLKKNNAMEKTVLIRKHKDKLERFNGGFQCNSDHPIVITGTKAELWLDVAEWLVRRGARKLVILTEEEQLAGSHVRRFHKLINRLKTTIIMTSLARVNKHDGAMDLFKEILCLGTISFIFCMLMDENSSQMKSLDSASRQMLPQLQQFVSLLGEGAAVCESRAAKGLPVCSVQSDSPLQTPAHVLPYLSTLLVDSSFQSRFFHVSDNIRDNFETDALEMHTFLPFSLEVIHNMGLQVSDRPSFTEVVTQSPGYCHTRHCLLPVFIIPGLGSDLLEPLTRQLINPAFCCSLPATIESVNNFAEILLEDVLKIQTSGCYNIMGYSWNGAVALELGCLLEARGHKVELLLLEGIPSQTQDKVTALCERYSADLGTSLLVNSLNLSAEATKKLSQQNIWEEKLQFGLEQVAVTMRWSVGRAMTYLHSQLTALLNFKPSTQLFQGGITLISRKHLSPAVIAKLSQFYEQTPRLFITEDDTLAQLITNSKTASIINEHIYYDWSL